MKKIFSFVIVLAAVAMVGCGGNTNKKAVATEAAATEAAAQQSACEACPEKCDSTATCCEKADSTKACCEKTEACEAAK